MEYTYSLVKADIRWYESAGKEKNYVLKSADELMGFCLLANGSIDGVSENFNEWTLSLGNSIDLENSEWKPIRSFAGAFDGKGYEITGLNVNYKGDDFNSKTAGMFEKLDSTGKILSLAVSGSVKADGKIMWAELSVRLQPEVKSVFAAVILMLKSMRQTAPPTAWHTAVWRVKFKVRFPTA